MEEPWRWVEAKLEAKLATAIQGKGSEGQGANFRDTEEMELAACLPPSIPLAPHSFMPLFRFLE